MRETKCVRDNFEMLVTVLANFVPNTLHLLTLAPGTNIQKISSMSKFCHRNPKIVTNIKSPTSTDIYVAYFRLSNKFYFSISHYSTTSTSSTAYIIGGFLSPNIIAQYKHGQWSKVGDLSTGRYGHGSITDGVQTIIIGGNVSG